MGSKGINDLFKEIYSSKISSLLPFNNPFQLLDYRFIYKDSMLLEILTDHDSSK